MAACNKSVSLQGNAKATSDTLARCTPRALRRRARCVASAVQTSNISVLKQLHKSLMLSEGDRQSIPILVPNRDSLPFAMSLEILRHPNSEEADGPSSTSNKTPEAKSSHGTTIDNILTAHGIPGHTEKEITSAKMAGMYELLYFLEGKGSIILNGAVIEDVESGDSVMAAAGRMSVSHRQSDSDDVCAPVDENSETSNTTPASRRQWKRWRRDFGLSNALVSIDHFVRGDNNLFGHASMLHQPSAPPPVQPVPTNLSPPTLGVTPIRPSSRSDSNAPLTTASRAKDSGSSNPDNSSIGQDTTAGHQTMSQGESSGHADTEMGLDFLSESGELQGDDQAVRLAYLRVLIPRDFMLAEGDTAEIQQCCEKAAKATQHWEMHNAAPLPPEELSHFLSAATRNADQMLHTILTSSTPEPRNLSPEPSEASRSQSSETLPTLTMPPTDDPTTAPLHPLQSIDHGDETTAVDYSDLQFSTHAIDSMDEWEYIALNQYSAFQESANEQQGSDALQSTWLRISKAAVSPWQAMLGTAHARAAQLQCPFTKISLCDAPAYKLPNQDNRLALVFDPFRAEVPFTFGIEIFPPGHETPSHVHTTAHELFFILAGHGWAFCNGERFPVEPGDTVVFPPGCEHGIDNATGGRMYCLELMLPNEMFAELVQAGTRMDSLDGTDMCVLASVGCR